MCFKDCAFITLDFFNILELKKIFIILWSKMVLCHGRAKMGMQ